VYEWLCGYRKPVLDGMIRFKSALCFVIDMTTIMIMIFGNFGSITPKILYRLVLSSSIQLVNTCNWRVLNCMPVLAYCEANQRVCVCCKWITETNSKGAADSRQRRLGRVAVGRTRQGCRRQRIAAPDPKKWYRESSLTCELCSLFQSRRIVEKRTDWIRRSESS